jgi:hypothetical protein
MFSGNGEANNRKSLCAADLLARSSFSENHTCIHVDITDGCYNLSEADGKFDILNMGHIRVSCSQKYLHLLHKFKTSRKVAGSSPDEAIGFFQLT